MSRQCSNDDSSLYSRVEGVQSEDFMYKPIHFVRSHCKDDNEEDHTTQIWDVAFEPGQGGCVATCGGPFLCIFKVSTGELLRKYSHKDGNHELFCLAWTTISNGNFLASGSSSGEVRLYHPEGLVSFHCWIPKKGQAVNSVRFHDNQPSWLFVASSPSGVSLWDLHDPAPPRYMKQNETLLLRVATVNQCDLYCMAWVGQSSWLLIGGSQGLIGWRVKEYKVREGSFPKYQPKMVELELPPGPGREDDQGPYVDSVTSLGAGLVAAKCVGYGKIIVFKANFNVKSEGSTSYAKVEVLAQYAWQKTTDFYMNIGGDISLRLMGCGDDNGSIWLYSLPPWLCGVDETLAEDDRKVSGPKKYMPLGHLPWPEIKGKKPGSGREKTMLDKVAFSPCGGFIVAVTNTNIVAIWKKVERSEVSSAV